MANNIYTYQKNVSTSGTPVQLQSQAVEPDQVVLIKAKVANTGIISVGYDSASALNSSTSHLKLRAGESVPIKIPDTSKIWIDSTVNGEGVEFIVGGSGSLAGSGGGASTADGSSFTAGSTAGTIAEGVYETTPTTVTNNKAAAIGINLIRHVKTQEQWIPRYENNDLGVAETRSKSLFINMTASGQLKSGAPGTISGIFVSAASGTPTIKIWNSQSASGAVLIDTFTPVAGTMYHFGRDIEASVGMYVSIGGTVSCTPFYN